MAMLAVSLAAAVLLLASQIYWITRVQRSQHGYRWWIVCATLAALLYAASSELSFAALQWWLACSSVAFILAAPAEAMKRLTRRTFIRHAANTMVAAPFLAGGYAALHGRLNLRTIQMRVELPRLPREFHGLRIAQMSDFHISAFMTEEQIRRYVDVANSLRADLIALTGDYLSWDPSAAEAVVRALAGLKAPHGVFACLGNHEAWSQSKDHVSALLQQAGIRVLRDESVSIHAGSETVHLAGIEPEHGWISERVPMDLVRPGGINILLSHYPTVFDDAAESGVDLTLAGHTHGGQVDLNFVSRFAAPVLLKSPYVAGLFTKRNAHLYVNSGIGTIGVPMRFGVPPEITVLELVHP